MQRIPLTKHSVVRQSMVHAENMQEKTSPHLLQSFAKTTAHVGEEHTPHAHTCTWGKVPTVCCAKTRWWLICSVDGFPASTVTNCGQASRPQLCQEQHPPTGMLASLPCMPMPADSSIMPWGVMPSNNTPIRQAAESPCSQKGNAPTNLHQKPPPKATALHHRPPVSCCAVAAIL